MRILTVTLAAILLTIGGSISANGGGASPPPIDEPLPASTHGDPLMLFAQMGGPGDPRGHGPDRKGSRGRMAQQRKHLEQLRMLKMLELLDLKEEQEVQFLTSYRAMRRDLREVDEKRALAVDELSQGLQTDSLSETAINNLVERILQTEDDRRQVHREFMKTIRTQLTPQQFGLLVIFHERFERELLEQVRAFREFRQEKQPDEPSSP